MCFSVWYLFIAAYVFLAAGTGLPLIWLLTKKVREEVVPESIAEHPYFSEDSKERIQANYRRIAGALGFWKLRANQNRFLTTYVAWWAIPSSIVVPIIAQGADSRESAHFITLLSAFSAILLVMSQRLKTEINFRAYREGESAFYDAFRALMDDPERFGPTEKEQLREYFKSVEAIRKSVREGELASLAKLET